MVISNNDLCRFMSKVKFFEKNKCWNWNGWLDKNGYGNFRYGPAKIRSHRFSYMISKGAIPTNMLICHTCDNPSCVNPDHLYAGTPKQNTIDSVVRKRHVEARKTHCKNGHAFAVGILYRNNFGKRVCGICNKNQKKKTYTTEARRDRYKLEKTKETAEQRAKRLLYMKNYNKINRG